MAGRFAAPVWHGHWDGIRDALAYGATSPQPDRGITMIPEPIIAGDNELNLNVFTPDLGAAGLPVLVWIHGGGFRVPAQQLAAAKAEAGGAVVKSRGSPPRPRPRSRPARSTCSDQPSRSGSCSQKPHPRTGAFPQVNPRMNDGNTT
jgi:hypothetical protein